MIVETISCLIIVPFKLKLIVTDGSTDHALQFTNHGSCILLVFQNHTVPVIIYSAVQDHEEIKLK